MNAKNIIALVLASVALAFAACDQGNEGDRCNPSLSNDECGGNPLSCQQPAECPEYYCCPTSGTSTNPYCQTGCAGGADSICAAIGNDASFCDSGASPPADAAPDASPPDAGGSDASPG
jgi:hypothetical protein